MELKPSEKLLIGKWVFKNKRLEKDDTATRIEALIKNHLNKIAVDESGWLTLFQDPKDKRYWELSYPDSGYSGGGAPILKNILDSEIEDKYILGSLEEE